MRIFSGIRPSGELHIGNYLGAIKQWIELQEKEECVFCIADLHATTTPYQPNQLSKAVFATAVTYISAGLDPEKCILFVQSKVKEHTELTWLLGTITPVGDLKRMTQFKEKSKEHPQYVNAGLLNYPLLMASDILLYQTDLVPVGKDQSQHVELTREIARRFNKKFGETFKIPKVLLSKGEKIMSLKNPTKKMSKTDNPQTYIGLFDKPEAIKKKIYSAKTDSEKEIKFDVKRKPGISNLLAIYSLFSGFPIKEIEKEFKEKGYQVFKEKLAQLLIEKLEPFRRKKKELELHPDYLEKVLEDGRKRAQAIAQQTMEKVRKKMGLF
ncbi:tryptophan--tRNA ligase [bacterium]|nr:tryptophan--tRNA ligase [bacterium]